MSAVIVPFYILGCAKVEVVYMKRQNFSIAKDIWDIQRLLCSKTRSGYAVTNKGRELCLVDNDCKRTT